MIAALAWLGRQGTRAIAALVFVGVAVPPLGTALKPFFTESIFVLLVVAFLRLDLAVLRTHLRRPGLIIFATAWSMVAIPLLYGGICLAIGLDARAPDLFLALMLQAVASPMMAAPAFTALMGLDATLVLVGMVLGTALTPLTAPFFAWLFLGQGLSIAPLALGVKLLAILAGAALVAAILRRFISLATVRQHKDVLDGLNVVVLMVFIAAVMANVAASVWAMPLIVLGLAVLGVGVFLAVLVASALLFVRAGREQAFALGFMASQRNMGLMLGAVGGGLPDLVWLYFATCQLPIYLSPMLLKPLARRLRLRRPRCDLAG